MHHVLVITQAVYYIFHNILMSQATLTSRLSALRAKLAQGSLLRAMVQGFMTVAALTLLAKGASFFKDAAVAHRFGISDSLDAFGLAFGVHSFATALIGSGIPAAFLPAYSQLKHRRGELRAERLAVQASLSHLISLLFVAALIQMFGGQLVHLLGHGFPPEKQALAQHLMGGLTPFLICFGMSMQLGNWLRSNKLFGIATAAPLLIPLAILGALFATHRDAPIDVLVWSTNAGAVLHVMVLILVIRRRLPHKLRWWVHCVQRIEPTNRIILRGALPFIISSIVLGGAPMVDQAMAAQLSSGSVTVLGYSDKVCGIILALTASAASEALFPFFADAVARHEWQALKKQLISTTGAILACAVPMVALLCWQAPLVVKLLFERGEFSSEDTARVAEVLRYAALQIPFYISSMIMSRVVVSLQANWFTLVTAVISLVSNVAFNLLFMRYLGVAGIALSTAVVYVFSCVMLFIYLFLKIAQQEREDSARRAHG